MELNRSQFDSLRERSKLRLSLIGMSNIGKSYLCRQLAKAGFAVFDCDERIERKLGDQLKALGYSGIADMSRWMGQPYDERYAKNQEVYLGKEREVLREIVDQLDGNPKGNIAIDTTGSVIHAGEEFCEGLKARSLMVYIEAPKKMVDSLFETYFQEPKPTVFGDRYNRENGQSIKEAMADSYRELLRYREVLYGRFADIVIPRQEIPEHIDADLFLQIIREQL